MSPESGEGDRAERLRAFAAEAQEHLTGPESAAWMDRLEREHDGLRAAFLWFTEHDKGAEALKLAADLWMFQQERGHVDESRDWLRKALAAPGANPRTITRARALYGAGILAFRGLDESAAQGSFEECLAIAQEQNDPTLIVQAATGLARVALRRGDTHEVRRHSELGLRVARERGDKADTARPIHMLAAASRVDGDFRQAKAFYRESLALNRELDRPSSVSVELENLGALEVLEGNIREALPLLRESLEIAHERGDKYLAPYDLIWLGRVAFAEGDLERGAKLLAAAKHEFDTTGLAMDPDEAPEYEKGLAAIRGAMEAGAFAAAWEAGQRMTLDDATAYALREG